MINCKYRTDATCDLINTRLGWRHGCPEHICQQCVSLGIETDKALEFREKVALSWIDIVKKHIHMASEQMLKVLVRDHLSSEEIEQIKRNPEIRWNFSRKSRWALVAETWSMAHSFMKAMRSRGFSGTRVELTIHNRRHISCTGKDLDGNQLSAPCPALRATPDGRHHFCGECGCKDKEIAWIDRDEYPKLSYPDLECPRGNPGFSNEGMVSKPLTAFDETLSAGHPLLDSAAVPPGPTSSTPSGEPPSSTEPTDPPSASGASTPVAPSS